MRGRGAMTSTPAQVHHFQAYLAFNIGRFDMAAEDLEKAVHLDPRNPAYLFDLGLVYERLQVPAKAMRAFAAAGTPAALHNAAVLAARGGADKRATVYRRRARAASPLLMWRRRGAALDEASAWAIDGLETAETQDLIAHAYRAIGALAQAGRASERAIAAEPTAQRYFTRSTIDRSLGRYEEAAAALTQALARDPNLPGAAVEMGYLSELLRRYEVAVEHYKGALAGDPNDWFVLARLLAVYAHLGELRAADETHRKLQDALRRSPQRPYHWEKLCTVAYRTTIWPVDEQARRVVTSAIDTQLAELARAHAHKGPASLVPPSRIRVGYLSAFLGDHPIGHNTAPMIAAHDRSRYEIHVFSASGGDNPYSEAILRGAETFHTLAGDPAAIADQIRAAGIEILVYTDGYMQHSLMAAMAMKPAPIQVFWPGHAGEAVLRSIDYIIADHIVVPPQDEASYRAKIVFLPDGWHHASAQAIAAVPSRRAAGLPESGFVFCAFNNPEKIDLQIFQGWMRILQAVAGSVLWLSAGRSPALAENLRQEAQKHGVSGERLIFAARAPDKADHLARHRCADLFLDTMTLNAATTAVDALWSGLPVLALRGERFASRISSTILNAIGLADTICATPAEYEQRAVYLATHPHELAALRARLAANRGTHPLFDTERYCRNLEKVYATMITRARAGHPPASFDVE